MKMLSAATCIFLFSLLFATTVSAAPETFTIKVGDIRVSMLSEGQSEGDPKILIGASQEDLSQFIPNGKYPTAVAVYLIRSGNDTMLVDTGFGKNTAANLRSLNLSARDIRRVLITHSHGDHIGGLVKDGQAAFPKAKVYISKPEYDWSAEARKAISTYNGRVETFLPSTFDVTGQELIRGVRAIAAYGHTPGHTLFLIESRGEKLLIWGDIAHAMAIQMPRPEISVTYDSHPDQAAATRRSVLKYVSEQNIPVAGMHIPYPGIGYIRPDQANPGGYHFEPYENKTR